jgi:hypothetical protein
LTSGWYPWVIEVWRALLALGVGFLVYELTRQRRPP